MKRNDCLICGLIALRLLPHSYEHKYHYNVYKSTVLAVPQARIAIINNNTGISIFYHIASHSHAGLWIPIRFDCLFCPIMWRLNSRQGPIVPRGKCRVCPSRTVAVGRMNIWKKHKSKTKKKKKCEYNRNFVSIAPVFVYKSIRGIVFNIHLPCEEIEAWFFYSVVRSFISRMFGDLGSVAPSSS